MKLRLHLLAAGLVAATIWACAREHAAPTDPSNAALSIHVTFPSITPTAISPGDEDRPETSSRRLVTTIRARATDLETGEIAAEESVELAPDDTRFRLELAVPPDRDYRVDIGASGTRETGGLSTEPGLLYSGFGLAYRVNTDEPTVVEITLENRVPFLTGQVVTDVISLRWTAVASAIGYQVRETINDESRELDFTDLQLEIPIPPHRDPAGGGETRSYRVRAKLPLNSSAYSEPYQLQLSGPTPPAAVTDLAAVDVGDVSLELRWTAPGDDEDVGQADHYDVRISTAPIDESNFTEAEPVPSIPSPQPAGSVESLFVTGLVPETEYYFALRTFDDVPLASELSNVLVVSTVDRTPPDPAPSLLVSNLTEESLDLEWTATGDDGSTGQATAYDLRQSLSPITEANFETATPISGLPDPGPLGTPASVSLSQLTPDTEYYFALRILDEAGNGSNLTTTSAHTLDLVPPAATTSLIATAISENEITLEWTAAGDNGKAGQAATYDIRFSTSPLDPGDFDQATPVATPPPAPAPAGSPESFTTAGFERETRYYLALRTLDEAENASAFSNVVEVVTLDLTAPSQIRDLVATPVSDHSVQLSWTAPGDDASTGTAARYELRYAEFTINPDNFDQATPAPTPDPAPAGSHESVEVSGLVEGRAYTFAVRALDNAGNPAPLSIVVSASPADVIPPSAVADLSVLDVGRDLIALQWTAPGDDGDLGQAASYDVRFATFPITEANVEDATPATGLPDPRPAGDLEQATVPGLAPATTYYLALRTKDEAGNVSALSNVVQATTGALPPATPTDLLATTASDQAIDLTWTDVATDEESYDVERGDPASQDFEIVATLPGPFAGSVDYRDDGLTERTEYKYRVRAHNSGGASGYSNEALARTAMSAPTGLVADPIGTTLVTLTWTFGTDPDGFRIERRTGNGAFGLLADIGGSARDFQDDQTAPLTDYTYRVQGYDSFGSSGFSNEASATTPDDDPLCQVVPSFLDFGIVEAGFVKSRSFTIENVGGGTLTGVVSAQCDGEWNITAGAGSYALGAGEIRTVTVEFAPAAVGSYLCVVDVGGSCGFLDCLGEGLDPRGFWASGFGSPPAQNGVNATVRTFYLFGGQLIVGGDFTRAGAVLPSYVARWTGTSWLDLDGGVPGPVYALSEYFSQLHAGGSFTEAASPRRGGPRNRIAYYNAGFGWGGYSEFPDDTILTMVQAAQPTSFPPIILGGPFVTGDARTLNHTAEFEDGVLGAIGSLDNPGVNGTVRATAVFNGMTILGGDFTQADLLTANHVVAWSGTGWSPLGAGTNGPVYAMARNGSLLYVGGDFTTAGGVSAPGIAVWNGSTWSAVAPGIDFRPVRALFQFDGDIIAGGPWELTVDDLPLNRIAAWNGQRWQPLGLGIGDGEVLSIGALDGSLFVGGTFSSAGGVAASNIARWDPNIPR